MSNDSSMTLKTVVVLHGRNPEHDIEYELWLTAYVNEYVEHQIRIDYSFDQAYKHRYQWEGLISVYDYEGVLREINYENS